jgi:hypothetical protein
MLSGAAAKALLANRIKRQKKIILSARDGSSCSRLNGRKFPPARLFPFAVRPIRLFDKEGRGEILRSIDHGKNSPASPFGKGGTKIRRPLPKYVLDKTGIKEDFRFDLARGMIMNFG